MTPSQVDQAPRALLKASAGAAQATTRVTKGDAGPLGQVALIGRAVTGQESSGQLGQVPVVVGHVRRVTQPVTHEDEALLAADHRPSDRDPPDG